MHQLVVGTESCQTHHVGAVTSGELQVRHDDGTEVRGGPGDAYVIEPGHDAWVIGSEPFVAYEFDSKAAEIRPSLTSHQTDWTEAREFDPISHGHVASGT